MKIKNLLPLTLILLAVISPLYGDITLPDVISSHMVLQRHKPVRIFGTASPGENITVAFGGQTKTTQADAQGDWHVFLDSMEANAAGRQMTITGDNTIVLDDILVGEVWLGSGQSNMAMALYSATDGGAMIDIATNLPAIRLFDVPHDVQTDDTLIWHTSNSDTNYYSYVRNFSAVLYYMGYKLHQELDVPVGLLLGAKGATAISGWKVSGGLYETQIAPMAPYTIRGVNWYQGESDVDNRGLAYADDMQELISGWRTAWDLPQMPFYYVQIAPYSYRTGDLPAIWEAQAAALKIDHTGMAVVHDTVDDLSNVHPSRKEEVGNRLALWALAKDYGQADLDYSGPLFESARIEGNQIRILFAHASGLKTDFDAPLDEFKIAGADRVFVDAEAVIDGETVVVSAASVPSPEVVQFGWHKLAQPNLLNGADLPAAPFQTDNWLGGVDEFRPPVPTGLSTVSGDGQVSLDWDDGFLSNQTYSVYRSTNTDLYGSALVSNLTLRSHVDSTAVNGTIYYYAVTTTDTNGIESAKSSPVAGIASSPGNQAPAFISDPIVDTNAQAGTVYSGSLAGEASDPESDPLIFSLVSGPGWLNVAEDGSMDGTPLSKDIGTNTFTVRVDAEGGNDTAVLDIIVAVPPSGYTENTFEQTVNEGGHYYLTNSINWSDGVLPFIGTGGIINSGTDAIVETATYWDITQKGSTIGINGAGLTTTIDDCIWTVNGGQLGDVNTTINASTLTVNTNGALVAGSGRDLRLINNSVVAVNGGTVSAGDQFLAQDQCRMVGSGTFTCGDIEVIDNAVLNLTNSTVTVAKRFGQRGRGSGGLIALNGCTLTADTFYVAGAGYELAFAGSTSGSANFTDWDASTADDQINVNFGQGTGMSMTLGSGARALSISSSAWAQALWENDQLLYNGSSSTDLGGLSWANATDSGAGVGNGEYFEFTPNGTYGGTLALSATGSGPPAAPTGLVATGGNGLVNLDWNAGGSDVSTYTVYRGMTSDGTYSAIQTDVITNAYTDSAVTNVTTYYYKVSAVGTNTLESAKSGYTAATPADPSNQAPVFISNPIIRTNATEGVAYSGTIAGDASDPESDPMTFSLVSTSSWLSVASDGGLSGTPGAGDVGTNLFTVQVSAAGGSDTATLNITVEDVPDTTPPAAPTGLTAAPGDGSVSLNWEDNSEDDMGTYSVYRSETSGNYSSAMVTGLSSSDYVDSTAVNGTTYYYVVTATDTNNHESAQSAEDSATPAEPAQGPATSFELSATANTDDFLTLPTVSSNDLANGITNVTNDGMSNFDAASLADGSFEPLGKDYENTDRNGTPPFRMILDLGSAVNIDTVYSYSNGTDPNRALQLFSLYGTASDSSSFTAGDGQFDESNWTLIASVDWSDYVTAPTAKNYRGVSSISGINASYKELMWVSSVPNDGTGTGQSNEHTVWREFDVFAGADPLPGYDLWASANGVGAATNDFDSDGLNNLYEYGLGGNPTDALDQGTLPTFTKSGSSFIYVHPKRTDDTSLTYTVETTTNLLDSGSWTNEGYTVTGINVTGETLNFVTNKVDTIQNEKFIRLKINQ